MITIFLIGTVIICSIMLIALTGVLLLIAVSYTLALIFRIVAIGAYMYRWLLRRRVVA